MGYSYRVTHGPNGCFNLLGTNSDTSMKHADSLSDLISTLEYIFTRHYNLENLSCYVVRDDDKKLYEGPLNEMVILGFRYIHEVRDGVI